MSPIIHFGTFTTVDYYFLIFIKLPLSGEFSSNVIENFINTFVILQNRKDEIKDGGDGGCLGW